MPYHTTCNHRGCPEGDCQMLTPEELEPGAEDLELAARLVEEGYLSISRKYRMVARLTDKVPTAKDIIRPEMLDTPIGREMAKWWEGHQCYLLRMVASGAGGDGCMTLPHTRERISIVDLVEVRELTIKQFRAFKKLGGESA